mgnify:CR=1 FL=1
MNPVFIDFFDISSAFIKAAVVIIAVPCWSSWNTGMSNSSFAPDRCTECIDQYIYVSEGIAYNSCKCSNCDTNVPNLATSIFSVYYRTDGEGLQRPLCTTCALRMKLMDVPLNIDLTNQKS